MSESEVRRLEDEGEPAPEDLTESTAVVYMSDSDVVRLDSSASGGPAPAPGAAAPPSPPKKIAPGPPPRSQPPRGAPARPAAPAAGGGRPRSALAVAVPLVLLGALGALAAGYAVHRMKEVELEEERATRERLLEEALAQGKAAQDTLRRVLEEKISAREEELRRAREDLTASRLAIEEASRSAQAERRRMQDDYQAAEATLKESFAASQAVEGRQIEKRERERAARERLDLERRARETIERFQALLDEAERRHAAESEVMRREAKAEILRREAIVRKQLEEETAAFEAEKAKAIELETQELEERLRAEFESDRGGFIRGGEGGGGEGEGIDLEAEVWEHLKGHLSGTAEYRLYAAFEESPQPAAERFLHQGIIRLRYDLKFLESLELVLLPRLRFDNGALTEGTQDQWEEKQVKRPSFTLEEATLGGSLGSFDLKLGKQIFSWGTADLWNPTDVLNPVDFTDLLDSEKIGVPSADISFYPEDETRLRLIALPTFTPARIPLPLERWNPIPPGGIFFVTPLGEVGPVPFARRDLPARTGENLQLAGRASTTLAGFDLSATYIYGRNDLPSYTLDPRADPLVPVEITPRYDRYHMLGADASTTVWELELHGEAAHFTTEGDRDDDYLQYTAGGRWTGGDLALAKDELRIILEFASEWVTREGAGASSLSGTAFARAFRSAVLHRIAYKPFAQLEFQGTFAAVLWGEENFYVRPEVSYELGSHTKLRAGFDILAGPRDTFFGGFAGEDRFWLSFKLSF
jgi:hypothetical protein